MMKTMEKLNCLFTFVPLAYDDDWALQGDLLTSCDISDVPVTCQDGRGEGEGGREGEREQGEGGGGAGRNIGPGPTIKVSEPLPLPLHKHGMGGALLLFQIPGSRDEVRMAAES